MLLSSFLTIDLEIVDLVQYSLKGHCANNYKPSILPQEITCLAFPMAAVEGEKRKAGETVQRRKITTAMDLTLQPQKVNKKVCENIICALTHYLTSAIFKRMKQRMETWPRNTFHL